MKLRPYQEDAVDLAIEAMNACGSTLVTWATGLGKTVMFAHVIDRYLQDRGQGGGRVMVMAHRGELLQQAADKIVRITGAGIAFEKAEQYADRNGEGLMTWTEPVVLTSVQTQIAKRGDAKRMNRFDPNDFALLVVDEAHHATSATWREVIDYYRKNPNLHVLGLTATPNRHDEEALGKVFESVAHNVGIHDGIMEGWLVDIDQQSIFVKTLDMSSVGTTAGDLNGRDLAMVMEYEENLHGVVKPTIEAAQDRKTLVFAASVAHAERMTEIFNRHNPGSAVFVHGGTPPDERRESIAMFRSGQARVLCNCGIATEGFDVPDIEVVAIARPTKSLPLYTQMIGRGTRVLTELNIDQYSDNESRRAAIKASTKRSLLVLDFVGNSGKHKLCSVVDALAGNYSDAIIDRAKKTILDDGDAENVREALSEAEKAEIEESRIKNKAGTAEEERLRRGVRPGVVFSSVAVNPFDTFQISAMREPGWNKGRLPSARMADALKKFKIPDPESMTYNGARQLLDKVIDRAKRGAATFPMTVQLAKRGFPIDCSFEQGREWMNAVADSGWKLTWEQHSKTHGTEYGKMKESAE